MNIKGEFEKYGETYTYDITDEQKDEVIKKLIEYYADQKHCLCGEGIMQSDNSILDAPHVLADICDNIIKFEGGDEEQY